MGLDSVELVMDFEDHFKILLPDEEVFKCLTPGMVTDLIYSILQKIEKDKCQTQVAFYKIRKVLTDKLKIPRANIKSSMRLEQLFPKKNRYHPWNVLLSEITFHPDLRHRLLFPRDIEYSLSAILFISVIAIFINTILAFLLFFLYLLLLYFLSPMRTVFPAGLIFLNDLIEISNCPTKIDYSREQILAIVIDISAEKMQIERNLIKEDSNYVKDLGLN
ncbi:MAG: acyl carrier protein [Candidatus Riflebacteria bacterium]|nr:acyl carrier protein [Candidatus Riflebacteria bacterium]